MPDEAGQHVPMIDDGSSFSEFDEPISVSSLPVMREYRVAASGFFMLS
jgi:hypothetical protein